MTETSTRPATRAPRYYRIGPLHIRVRGWILAGLVASLAVWALIGWLIFG